jgi:hypothetical protein
MKLLQPVLDPADVNLCDPSHGPWEVVACPMPWADDPGNVLEGLKCVDPREAGETWYDPDQDWIDDELLYGLLLGPKYVGASWHNGSCYGEMYLSVWDRVTGHRVGFLHWSDGEDVSKARWQSPETEESPGFLVGHEELVAKLVSMGM